MIEMQSVITGRVQGVRYRDYVQAVAGELGLVGFVRNNPDGTVLVVAQGEPDTLKTLLNICTKDRFCLLLRPFRLIGVPRV